LPVGLVLPPRAVKPPLATSPTKPVQAVHATSCKSLALTPAKAPPKVTVKPVSVSVLTVTVPPAGQALMASTAAFTPAVVKFVPRTMGAESAPL
jgi:hypothetical protein